MTIYNHIIVGIDLSGAGETLVKKANEIATAMGAKISLVHAIEPLSFAYGGDLPLDFSGIQDEIQVEANKKLQELAVLINIPEDRCHLVVGRPEKEIQATAEKVGADLIIVGSHGRHGLALLLGSTSNGVLHGAKCDVLAIHVED